MCVCVCLCGVFHMAIYRSAVLIPHNARDYRAEQIYQSIFHGVLVTRCKIPCMRMDVLASGKTVWRVWAGRDYRGELALLSLKLGLGGGVSCRSK